MAGNRRQLGKPTRADARNDRFYQRLNSASCAEDQLAVAFDWWRLTVSRIEDPARRAGLLRELSQQLVREVQQLTGWSPLASEIHQRRADAHQQRQADRAAAESGGSAWWTEEQQQPQRRPRRYPWAGYSA